MMASSELGEKFDRPNWRMRRALTPLPGECRKTSVAQDLAPQTSWISSKQCGIAERLDAGLATAEKLRPSLARNQHAPLLHNDRRRLRQWRRLARRFVPHQKFGMCGECTFTCCLFACFNCNASEPRPPSSLAVSAPRKMRYVRATGHSRKIVPLTRLCYITTGTTRCILCHDSV